jgi:AraC-like DNA-binding protein
VIKHHQYDKGGETLDSKRRAIQTALGFIESKLPEQFDISELAGRAFFSKSYFQRLFVEIIGEPVMEYVNKRRMQRAGAALLSTGETVLELALRMGFDSHEGFTRAFKAYYGLPPAAYRKAVKYLKEGKIMLSNELSASFARHMNAVAERLELAKTEMEALVKETSKASGATPFNGTMLVLTDEWKHFASRAGNIANGARAFLTGGPSVFELADKVYGMLKTIDDAEFQMHLLRFLGVIEITRMGAREFELFTGVIKKYDAFSGTFAGGKDETAAALNDLLTMISVEIEYDAAQRLKEITILLDTAASDMTVLYNRLLGVSEELGGHGGPTAWIGTEIAAQVELINKSRKVFLNVKPRLRGEVTDIAAHIKEVTQSEEEIHVAFRNITDAAFHMNIAAFNLTIETARAGSTAPADMQACADTVRGYADKLNGVNAECAALYGEYKKLAALLNRKPKTERDPRKIISDYVFQCELIRNQLILEAERAKNDAFKDSAAKLTAACEELIRSGQDNARQFRDALKEIGAEIKREAEAGGLRGRTFAFIAAELIAFAESAGNI